VRGEAITGMRTGLSATLPASGYVDPKLTTKPAENGGTRRSTWHEPRLRPNTNGIAQHPADGEQALWQSEGQGFESPRVHQSSHNTNPCRGDTVFGVCELPVDLDIDDETLEEGLFLGWRPLV
jgi:hypothetical protein